MAIPRKVFVNAFWLAGILIAAAGIWLWHLVSPKPDQEIHVTEQMLVELAELGARPKYVPEPSTGYVGVGPEPARVIAEGQLNGLFQRLGESLEAKPSKKFVLKEFSKTLALFDPVDTEDRERVCRYLQEIMDILGIESSDGLLNNWMYGPVLGPIMSRMAQDG